MAEDDPGLTTTGTQYLVADHLGSTRMVLGSDGTCVHRIDYLPFGGESPRTEPCYGGDPPTNPSNVSLKFTGKERDAETDLDYFGARYFSGMQGRFSSPNIPLIDQIPFDPQSWNLYSYVRNNPFMYIDPTGRTCVQAQTIDPNGRKHDTFVDNGNGKGCEPAGIKPDSEGGLSASGQQFNVNDQQGSLFDLLMASNVPRYVPNDKPLPENARKVMTVAYYRPAHDLGCAGLGLAVGDMGAAAFSAGQPTIEKPYSQGGAPRTSPASEAFRKWTGGARGGRRLLAFEGGPGTGMPLKYRPTNSVGGVWARWLPIVGGALTLLSAWEMNACLSTTP